MEKIKFKKFIFTSVFLGKMSGYVPVDYLYFARVDNCVVIGRGEGNKQWFIHTSDPDQVLARLILDSKFRSDVLGFPEGSHFERSGLIGISPVNTGKKLETITQESTA